MSDDTPSAVMASTTTVRTMADGSLRISLDIEPRHARDAFNLFGAPGTPVALARMTPEAATAEARKEFQQPAAPTVKGGALCKLAAIWCNDPEFHAFLTATMRWAAGYSEPVTPEVAARIIRETCGVESRAELDHNLDAEAIFHRDFRLPFQRWTQGVRP